MDRIDALRCQYRTNPLGLDVAVPKLTYRIVSKRTGAAQTARRVQVSTREDFTGSLVWDSGRVAGRETAHIPFGGGPLCPKTRYFWRVRSWDEKGRAGAWSDVAWFETGFLGSDWAAHWVEPEQETAVKDIRGDFRTALTPHPVREYDDVLRPPRYLRKEFTADRPVVRARLHATSHGVYRCEINGTRVGDRVLAPEITPYPKLLQYQTYDVTDLVRTGGNAWGAVVADGWWIGRLGFLSDSCQYGDRLAFLGQLELDFDDGSRAVVATDASFMSTAGAYVWSDLFVGEKQDARREPLDWSFPGFDATGWTAVREIPGDFENLEGQATDGVVALETLPVRYVLRTPRGESVLDFGQVVSGRVRLRVRGSSGDFVALTHSETLDHDGSFLRNMLGRSKDQRDVFVLHGDGVEAFEPDFTYHGFRYVLVEGLRGEPDPADFTAVVLGSRLPVTGSFHCDDEDLNRLSQNIFRSQQGNLLSIPTDCPTREKSGFTGDAQVFAATGCFHMDLEGFLSHWLRQVRLEQSPEGIVPNIVPNFPDDNGNLSPDGILKASAAWGDAIAIVPWVLYEQYGDLGHLSDNYAAMKAWVDYARSQSPDGVWSTGEHFGDWMIPSLDTMEGGLQKSVAETSAPIATSYLAHSAGCVARAAALLGREEDARRYEALKEKVRAAYWNAFGSPSGRLSSHYQGIYVLALQFGMVPDAMRRKVADQLVHLIEDQGNRLDTGFTSVRFLLPVLCETGHEDVARRLLFQTECPSWLYEVRQGATTIWERWDAIKPDGTRSLHSYNHCTFGCVGEFLYGHVAGLKPLEPGFSRFALEPDVDFGLDRMELVYESIHGRIACTFEKKGGQLAIHATVPPNTTARIRLPGGGTGAIHALSHPGVASVSQRGHCAEVEVVAGTYEFRYPFHSADGRHA